MEDHVWMLLILVLQSQLVLISAILHPDGFNYEECPPSKTSCEYWLVIQEKLTMIFEKNLVYAHKGRLFLYNEHHTNFTTHVSYDMVIFRCIPERDKDCDMIFNDNHSDIWGAKLDCYYKNELRKY